ncbi:MAG: putative metallopeptidase [Gemmataceae bacterium]|nr:putative metallopeptidase [Gemmataceae bacterium]MDW8243168.1 putative metallopeptidase [Thermogemmata sp.]
MNHKRRAQNLAYELHWDAQHPLPRRWVVMPSGMVLRHAPGRHSVPSTKVPPWDFSAAMTRLCAHIVAHCQDLCHIRMEQLLVTYTPSRSRSRYGLQARVTPLRFRAGALTRRQGAWEYQVQRFFVDNREILYLITFCLPRFLDQSFEEKITTVFHELYHISPAFDGDLRRHHGRYCLHTHSKAAYDAHMRHLAKAYLRHHNQPQLLEFLHYDARRLAEQHGGIVATIVPRPKLLPVGGIALQAAARNQRISVPEQNQS